MSILITQEPSLITPSDNPIFFVFKQSDTFGSSSPKYKVSFIVEIFVSGFGSVGYFEIFPEFTVYGTPNYLFAKFDVSNIVRSYVEKPLFKPLTNSESIFDPLSYKEVSITVTEKYASTIDGVPGLGDTVPSSLIYVYKASISRKEFALWDYTVFNKGSMTKRFLTDKPYTSYSGIFNIYAYDFKKDDTFIISYFDDTYYLGGAVNYKLRIGMVDANGTNITTFDILYTTAVQGIINTISINLDQQVSLGNITSLQKDSVASISFALTDLSDVNISPFVLLRVYDPCFYAGKSVLWLNKYGAYDYFLFKHNERESATIKSLEYQRPDGEFLVDGTFSINPDQNGRTTYLKEKTKKLQLISDYLDQKTQNWLTQLYDSPFVLLNDGQDFENITVVNSVSDLKQDQYDDLYNEIVEIEFTSEKSILL